MRVVQDSLFQRSGRTRLDAEDFWRVAEGQTRSHIQRSILCILAIDYCRLQGTDMSQLPQPETREWDALHQLEI